MSSDWIPEWHCVTCGQSYKYADTVACPKCFGDPRDCLRREQAEKHSKMAIALIDPNRIAGREPTKGQEAIVHALLAVAAQLDRLASK